MSEREQGRDAFLETLGEAANLDEWVEQQFDADRLNDLAYFSGLDGDALRVELRADPVFAYHWQHREVYAAFDEEVWAAVFDRAERDDVHAVIDWLAQSGDGRHVLRHEDFIDIMVVRAIALIAEDLTSS